VNVTCDVVGGETETVSVAADATYADLCRAVGFSPHEVTVLVDGRPVAEDGTVTEERVELLRLVKGGGRAGATGRAR
jgi:sulfur carrier protein